MNCRLQHPAASTYGLVLRLIARNPSWAPSDAVDLAQGCAETLQAWIDSHTPTKHRHSIWLRTEESQTKERGKFEVLSYDFNSDYDVKVHLKVACTALEAALPGLGAQLLSTLSQINYKVCELGTPASVHSMAQHELWYGARTDKELRREMRYMGCDDEEWNYFEFTPDSYLDKLGVEYRTLGRKSVKLWSAERLSRLAKRQDPVGAVAALLAEVRLQTEQFVACTAQDRARFQQGQRIEPPFMFWWGDESTDPMGDVYDKIFEQRFEGCEDVDDGIVRFELRSDDDIEAAIRWIDAAIPVLDAVERLRLHLGSHWHELQC